MVFSLYAGLQPQLPLRWDEMGASLRIRASRCELVNAQRSLSLWFPVTVKRETTKSLPLLQAGAQQDSVSTELLRGLPPLFQSGSRTQGRVLVWESSHHLACMLSGLQVTGPKHFIVLTHAQHTPVFLALRTH